MMRITITPADLNSEFVRQVEELSGQNLAACYQCGKCSAGCPAVDEMDILPNQLIRLVQLVREEGLADKNTAWLCATCLSCAARCPRGVSVSKIAEAVRAIALRKGDDRIGVTQLPKEVLDSVPQQGLVSAMRKLTT